MPPSAVGCRPPENFPRGSAGGNLGGCSPAPCSRNGMSSTAAAASAAMTADLLISGSLPPWPAAGGGGGGRLVAGLSPRALCVAGVEGVAHLAGAGDLRAYPEAAPAGGTPVPCPAGPAAGKGGVGVL